MSQANEPVQDLDTGHEYDGIREYDNVLPNWWLATLWGTIIFAFGYWMYYHVLETGPLQMAEYHAEMQAAEEKMALAASARGAVTDETLTSLAAGPAVDEGKALFGTYCAACHGVKGEGGIGANLTDDYFLHGSKPTEILKVIEDGVPSKGMPAWGAMLGATKVEQVTAFVLTLHGTNLPGKAAEGELARD